jgi:hypothetical protein
MPKPRRPRVNRHYKIDNDLRFDDRGPYVAHLRDPRTTIDLAHAWLADHGFSRSAVARHRRHYLERREREEASLRQAQAFARFAASGGAPDFAAGALLQAEHLLFERVWEMKARAEAVADSPGPQKLCAVADAISALIATRERLIETQRRLAREGASTSVQSGDANSPEGSEPRFEVIAREVRRLLGIPLPAPGDSSRN